MKIKESELKSVLEAIEADLNSAFESQKANILAKADVSKQPEPEASASEGAGDAVASPPEAAADTGSPASSPSPESAPASDGSPAPAGDASAAPAPGADGAGDPGADQQLSPEALQAEYAQLPPEELDMHLQAAMAAKEAMMGQGAGGQAPQASAAPPMSPPASPSMPPMAMKAEIKPDAKAQGGQITHKSEPDPEIESLKSLIKSQSEDIEILAKAVKSALDRPERKAVTTVAALLKSEPEPKTYTNAEAKAKLNSLVPTLNKAERELVMDFYLGKVSVDKLTPILEKK